jgi:hypothetical protein
MKFKTPGYRCRWLQDFARFHQPGREPSQAAIAHGSCPRRNVVVASVGFKAFAR